MNPAPDSQAHVVGLWPVLEALRHRPGLLGRVAWHPRIPAEELQRLRQAAALAGVQVDEDEAMVSRLRRHRQAWVAATLDRPDDRLGAGDHLVLVRCAQAGNLGAVMRTALGFDLRQLALIEPRLDPWSPHVLRASQGAAFALRWSVWGSWAAYRADHPEHEAIALLPPADGRASPLSELRAPAGSAAWVFGPEGGSLPQEVAMDARPLTIPQHPDLESHNLAVAVGVTLYARAVARDRQRSGS